MAGPALSVTVSGLSRLFGPDLRRVVEVARAADELGVDQLVLADHVVMGPRLDRYPFGTFPYPPGEPWPEPLTTLAAVAAATARIRLGTGILVAPARPAVLLAKQVATLDVLSGGRVDLGVGTGWQREELEAAGAAFARREHILDDTIAACRALWGDQPVTFTSETVSFAELWCEPRPVQARLPVWFAGGPTPRTARRIAGLGDGWMPIAGTSEADLRAGIAGARDALAAAGRDPAELLVRASAPPEWGVRGPAALAEAADRLGEMGVTTVAAGFGRSVDDPSAVVPWLESLVAAWAAG